MRNCISLLILAATLMFGAFSEVSAQNTDPEDVQGTSSVVPFYVPNAFSPNKDGINEHFMLKYELTPEETFSTFFMMICDRYGNVLFKTYNPSAYWDG